MELNKEEKVTESLHLTVEMTRRSNYNLRLNLRKLRVNEITAETTRRLYMKNPPTLRNDSSFVNTVSKTRDFAVYDKDYRNV